MYNHAIVYIFVLKECSWHCSSHKMVNLNLFDVFGSGKNFLYINVSFINQERANLMTLFHGLNQFYFSQEE